MIGWKGVGGGGHSVLPTCITSPALVAAECIKMCHESYTEGVVNIKTLHCEEITRHFRHTLTEPNSVVLHSKPGVTGVTSCW